MSELREHEIFHTESYFSVSSDELVKLAALTREFGTIEEMRIADLIANSLPQAVTQKICTGTTSASSPPHTMSVTYSAREQNAHAAGTAASRRRWQQYKPLY